MCDRLGQSSPQINSGLPAQHTFGLGNIRPTNLGVILYPFAQRTAVNQRNPRGVLSQVIDNPCELEDRILFWVSKIDRLYLIRHQQSDNPAHQVVDVTEGSCL